MTSTTRSATKMFYTEASDPAKTLASGCRHIAPAITAFSQRRALRDAERWWNAQWGARRADSRLDHW